MRDGAGGRVSRKGTTRFYYRIMVAWMIILYDNTRRHEVTSDSQLRSHTTRIIWPHSGGATYQFRPRYTTIIIYNYILCSGTRRPCSMSSGDTTTTADSYNNNDDDKENVKIYLFSSFGTSVVAAAYGP